MKRTTITLSDELEQAVAAYCQDKEIQPSLNAVLQTALRDYLAARGYLIPIKAMKITPAKRGNGKTDVSIHHDKYLKRGCWQAFFADKPVDTDINAMQLRDTRTGRDVDLS